MNGRVSFSTQRAQNQKMTTTQWLDIMVLQRSAGNVMRSTSFLASSLVTFGAILLY